MTIQRIESGVAPAKTRLKSIGGYYTGNIGAGSNETQVYTPPVGMIWKLQLAYLNFDSPNSASSGTHEVEIKAGDYSAIVGKSLFGQKIRWDNNMWIYADSAQEPATEVGAIVALHSIRISHNNPLSVKYYNDTNVVQGYGRSIYLNVLETPIT